MIKAVNAIKAAAVVALTGLSLQMSAQKYDNGLIDKSIAVVGNEMISLSQLEENVQMTRLRGMMSDKNVRCDLLEQMMISKLFLMQARLDSLNVNNEMVESEMSARINQLRTELGGDEGVEKYFGKPMYKLRQEWRETLQEQSLTQQMQSNVASKIPDLTPLDIEAYVKAADK